MTCLIIDDNPIAREILVQLASQVDDLVIAAECCNAMEAYNYLQKSDVDLLLLDIEMPEMTGLELTKNLGNKDVIIIFTTSKKDYAVEAFELNVVDYLVKPFAPARFIQAIDKARTILDEGTAGDDEFIFIRDSNIVRRLKISDILYAEAMGDYVKFYTTQKLYAIHVTFKTAEERLPASKFIRVHRSFIVALDKIDALRDGGVIIGDQYIPVADGYRKVLNRRINVI
jgi:DNA-binding LytR/AlgR family response regulator